MEYTVKLRSPYEFERAVRPYQTGDDIDMSANCDELGSGRDAKWLEPSPILNDKNPPELVFTDEGGKETIVKLMTTSGTRDADDEDMFPDNCLIKCVYWKNQESTGSMEIDGELDPSKITFRSHNVRIEDGTHILIMEWGSVEYDGEEIELSFEECDGSTERVRVFIGAEFREIDEVGDES